MSLEQIEIPHHSEEIDDIISIPPSWLIRWGTSLFLLVFLLLIGTSAVIRYPDIVRAPMVVTSSNWPKPVVSKIQTHIVELLVKDNELVRFGQPLAYLEGASDHRQVLSLLEDLARIKERYNQNLPLEINFDKYSLLGELQTDFQGFYKEYIFYKDNIVDGYYEKRRQLIYSEINAFKNQKTQLVKLKAIQQADYDIAKKDLDMHTRLHTEKVVADTEYRREESKLLLKTYPLQQTESLLINNDIEYARKERELLELDNLISESKARFAQSINSLIAIIEQWRNQYILSSPQNGVVIFNGSVQEGQYLKGEDVFYVHQSDSEYFGEIAIPQFNMGKVRVDQRVLIKLDSYPFEEYGIVTGTIKSISDVPTKENKYIIRVDVDVASLKRSLQLKNGMLATAEIITTESSLLTRFFRKIVKAIN